MRSLPPSFSSSRLRWFLALPKLGVVLLLAAVVTLLWLLHQNELEEERTSLIKDVLWLEQNVRFHLARSEEQLQQLATDLGNQPDRKRLFRIRASHMVKNNPDISQIAWFDAKRRVIDALPASTPADSGVEAFGPAATQKAFELAILLNKRIYSEPFFLSGNVAHFGQPHFHVTNHPDHIKSLFLAKSEDSPSLTASSPLLPVLGPSTVLTSNGARHMRQR